MRLYLKLGLLLSLMSIGIIVVISAFSISAIKSKLQFELSEQLGNDAANIMDKLDRLMFERISDAALLAETDILVVDVSFNATKAIDFLKRVESEKKMYASISLYNAAGIKIADTRGLKIGANESGKPFFSEAIQGSVYSDPRPIFSESLGIPVIHLSAPLRNTKGEISGVLVLRFPITKIHDLIEGLGERDSIQEEIEFDLVDQEGLILFSNHDKAEILNNRLSGLKMFRELSQNGQDSKSLVTYHEGEEMLFIGVKEKGHLDYESKDWMLIMRIKTDVIFSPISSLIKRIVAVSFGIFILVIILSFFLSKNITRPIQRLHEGTQEIEKGNFDVHVGTSSNDEIGQLSRSFDAMTTTLSSAKKQLEDYSKNLENKVAERTREIEQKDVILREINQRLNDSNVQLKELDKQKDAFISIAAHELKTPLTSIKGFAQLLKNGNFDPEKQKLYLEMINKNSDRLYRLILDLVDSSRISLGQLTINLEAIDPKKIFVDIRDNMELQIKEKGLEPIFIIQENLPPVMADYERTLQVIRNLMINAIHYTKVGSILLNISRNGDFVQFEIRDTGQGIPKENQDKIFSRFYQVDSSMTRKIGGSGLGLSVCKGLVESMKGKIWFESAPAQGTTFFFTLPVKK